MEGTRPAGSHSLRATQPPGSQNASPVQRQPSLCPNPSLPSEFHRPHAPPHSSTWRQASASHLRPPARPSPRKQLEHHERGPERRDTGANTQMGQQGPAEQTHRDLCFPGPNGTVLLGLLLFMYCLFSLKTLSYCSSDTSLLALVSPGSVSRFQSGPNDSCWYFLRI